MVKTLSFCCVIVNLLVIFERVYIISTYLLYFSLIGEISKFRCKYANAPKLKNSLYALEITKNCESEASYNQMRHIIDSA